MSEATHNQDDVNFFNACRNGDLETCKTLLKSINILKISKKTFSTRSPEFISKKVLAQYYTPLLIAISNQHVPIVKLLLENGFDPNQSTIHIHLKTPIHVAIALGRITTEYFDIIKMLVRYGANTLSKDQSGYTPLHLSVLVSPKVLEFVLQFYPILHFNEKDHKHPNGKGLLHTAASIFRGHERIEILFQNIPTLLNVVNDTDNESNTALHYAARKGIVKNCEILLYHGANPFLKNNRNTTPIEYLDLHQCLELEKLFSFHSKKYLLALL